mgnify:CR=1 FL=1
MREVGVEEDNKDMEEEEFGAAITSVDFSGKCLCVKVCQSSWQEFFLSAHSTKEYSDQTPALR